MRRPRRLCSRPGRLLRAGLFLVLVAGCGTTPVEEAPAGKRPPNILFILVDDLGKEWISAYGSDAIETPRIDQLAREGLRFDKAYSMPQCTPTRVTLLTGQYPFHHGWVQHWDVPRWGAGAHFDWRENASFARTIQALGYRTVAAGKWQINDFRVTPRAMARHGFEDWCMWTGYESQNPPSAERYWNPYVNTPEGSRTEVDKFGADVFVERLERFFREHRDEPVLAYFPMALTHGPLTSTPAEREVEGKARFAAMVRYMDRTVGRLIDLLEELGLREETYIVFTTDNGTGKGLRGSIAGREVRGGKATLHETGSCVPFIVSRPGTVPEGRVSEALVDFTDIYPTFVELAGGLERADGAPEADVLLDGRSFAPVLAGERQPEPREWILAMGAGKARLTEEGFRGRTPWRPRIIRDGRYKLRCEDRKTTAVFDLSSDPYEEENLIDSSEPRVLAARERLEAVIRSQPAQDAPPRYRPNPPQPWDLPVEDRR